MFGVASYNFYSDSHKSKTKSIGTGARSTQSILKGMRNHTSKPEKKQKLRISLSSIARYDFNLIFVHARLSSFFSSVYLMSKLKSKFFIYCIHFRIQIPPTSPIVILFIFRVFVVVSFFIWNQRRTATTPSE